MKQAIPKLIRQHAKIASLALFTWVSIGPVGGISARSNKAENRPVIRVRIYNYAHAYGLDLRKAERQAAYIFAKAGLRIAWTVYSDKKRADGPQPEDSDADFFVKIVSASMSAAYGQEPGVLGESLVPSGVHGPTPSGTAIVFYECVKDLSAGSRSSLGEILGDAMAHELGHLLLGSGHSTEGIMKGHWTLQDLRIASQGGLPFSQTQVMLLQRAAWSLHQDSSSTLAAQRSSQ